MARWYRCHCLMRRSESPVVVAIRILEALPGGRGALARAARPAPILACCSPTPASSSSLPVLCGRTLSEVAALGAPPERTQWMAVRATHAALQRRVPAAPAAAWPSGAGETARAGPARGVAPRAAACSSAVHQPWAGRAWLTAARRGEARRGPAGLRRQRPQVLLNMQTDERALPGRSSYCIFIVAHARCCTRLKHCAGDGRVCKTRSAIFGPAARADQAATTTYVRIVR